MTPLPSLYDIPLRTLDGRDATLREHAGQVLLVVNVASRCGLTPQYAALEALHEAHAARGFSVLGFPCDQFGGQEPGTADEIRQFCSSTYGVTFPMYDKVEVNGPSRHPLYDRLVAAAYPDGEAGDVRWNFEKFVVGRSGAVVARFVPKTPPDDPAVLAVLEDALAAPVS